MTACFIYLTMESFLLLMTADGGGFASIFYIGNRFWPAGTRRNGRKECSELAVHIFICRFANPLHWPHHSDSFPCHSGHTISMRASHISPFLPAALSGSVSGWLIKAKSLSMEQLLSPGLTTTRTTKQQDDDDQTDRRLTVMTGDFFPCSVPWQK